MGKNICSAPTSQSFRGELVSQQKTVSGLSAEGALRSPRYVVKSDEGFINGSKQLRKRSSDMQTRFLPSVLHHVLQQPDAPLSAEYSSFVEQFVEASGGEIKVNGVALLTSSFLLLNLKAQCSQGGMLLASRRRVDVVSRAHCSGVRSGVPGVSALCALVQ